MKKLLYILFLLPTSLFGQQTYQNNWSSQRFGNNGGTGTGKPGGSILADVGIKCGNAFEVDQNGRLLSQLSAGPLSITVTDSAFGSFLPVAYLGANRFDGDNIFIGIAVAADSDTTGETSWGAKNYQTQVARHIKAKYQSDEKYLILECYDSPTERQHMDINPDGFEVSQWSTGSKVSYQFSLGKGEPGYVYGMVSADSAGFMYPPAVGPRVATQNYGGTVSLTEGGSVYFTGSGTGTSTVQLGSSIPVGGIVIVSDLDSKAAANNIVIDAGVGNTINMQGTIVQTTTIVVDGSSYTLQKVTATKWMVI